MQGVHDRQTDGMRTSQDWGSRLRARLAGFNSSLDDTDVIGSLEMTWSCGPLDIIRPPLKDVIHWPRLINQKLFLGLKPLLMASRIARPKVGCGSEVCSMEPSIRSIRQVQDPFPGPRLKISSHRTVDAGWCLSGGA